MQSEQRFLVCHCPKIAGDLEHQPFSRKGTAMAYVKRKLPTNLTEQVQLKRQVPDEVASWKTLDTWTYYSDGRIEHVRA